MRITNVAQSKIPTEFRGKPIPQSVANAISEVDTSVSLSHGEIEWIMVSLEDVYGLISGNSKGDWPKLAKQLISIFTWAKENNKSVLGMSLSDVAHAALAYATDKKIKQAFIGRDWVLAYLNDKPDSLKTSMIDIDSKVDGGVRHEELEWLVAKRAFDRGMINPLFSADVDRIADIIKWSRTTGTSLSTINDFGTASMVVSEWKDYRRKQDLAKRLSKKGQRVVPLSKKWKAVWIDPDAIAKPPENDPELQEPEYEVEQQITGITLNSNNRLISIRDPSGVSQASMEMGDETSERIDIVSIEATISGRQATEEFSSKMASLGTKLWWAGDPVEISSVRDIEEVVDNEYGFVPSISVSRIGHISDVDSYKSAIDKAYEEGCSGSSFSMRTTGKIIDSIAVYAEKRNELYVMEAAREKFGDWCFDKWNEHKDQMEMEDSSFPREPQEDDFENPDGTINSTAYNSAEQAYYEAIAPYEKDFEPYATDERIHVEIQRLRDKPKNKAFYDIIDRQREEERRVEEVAREKERLIEVEKKRKQEEAEAYERAIKQRVQELDEAVGEFSDNLDFPIDIMDS